MRQKNNDYLWGAAFLPWSAATERKRQLFVKVSRFVVRWQTKKIEPVLRIWQHIIQKTRALEDSAASILYRIEAESFEAWADYSSYKAHLRRKAVKNATKMDRLLLQVCRRRMTSCAVWHALVIATHPDLCAGVDCLCFRAYALYPSDSSARVEKANGQAGAVALPRRH